MSTHDKAGIGEKARWVGGAFGIVIVYFGLIFALMYPALEAAGYVA
jgi:hypothetical protein